MVHIIQNETTLSYCKDGFFSVQMKTLSETLKPATAFENLRWAFALQTFQSLLEIAIRDESPMIVAMYSDDILTNDLAQFQIRRALVTQSKEDYSELWKPTGPTIHISGFV